MIAGYTCDDCGAFRPGSPYYTFPTATCVDHDGRLACTGTLCPDCAGPDLFPDVDDDPRRPTTDQGAAPDATRSTETPGSPEGGVGFGLAPDDRPAPAACWSCGIYPEYAQGLCNQCLDELRRTFTDGGDW